MEKKKRLWDDELLFEGDIYDIATADALLEDDEISPEEAAFIEGYMQAG